MLVSLTKPTKDGSLTMYESAAINNYLGALRLQRKKGNAVHCTEFESWVLRACVEIRGFVGSELQYCNQSNPACCSEQAKTQEREEDPQNCQFPLQFARVIVEIPS